MRFHLVVVMLLTVLSFKHLYASSDVMSAKVVVYNNENGLPQNSVNSMVFDKDGILWVGTNGGLVRFDGRNFEKIINPRITKVLRSFSDTIWVLDEYQKLYYFDKNSQRLIIHTANCKYTVGVFEKIFLGGEYKSPYSDYDLQYPHDIGVNFSEKCLYLRSTDNSIIYVGEYLKKIPNLSGAAKISIVGNFLLAKKESKNIQVYSRDTFLYTVSELNGPKSMDPDKFWNEAYFFNNKDGSYAIYDGSLFEIHLKDRTIKLQEILKDIPKKNVHKKCNLS